MGENACFGASRLGNDMQNGIKSLHDEYAHARRTPQDVLDELIAKVQAPDAHAHVFMSLTLDRAKAAAQASTERWRAGQVLGPLDGIPMVWKDVFDMSGTVTSCGSAAMAQALPAQQDAALVSTLEALGMVSVGKTTLSELAYSGLGINPYPGTPRNPVDAKVARIPGGSSSGSAAAVALGWVPCGMGSDTSGSIRVPAALQGLVGFKPSHGRYPTQGMYPLAPSLDTAGPLLRDARDACLLDEVLTGQVCASIAGLGGWCFVVPTGEALAQATPAVQDMIEAVLNRLSRAGARIMTREFLPFELTRQVFDRYGTLVAVEATQVHEGLMNSPAFAKVDPRIADRMRRGASLPQQNRDVIQSSRPSLVAMAAQHLSNREVLLYPTVAMTAPELAPLAQDAERFAQCNLQVLHNTMPGSYLDMPTLNLPAGRAKDGLPVGISLSMGQGQDSLLLGLGAAVQAVLQE